MAGEDVDDFLAGLEQEMVAETISSEPRDGDNVTWVSTLTEKGHRLGPCRGFSLCHMEKGMPYDTPILFRCFECGKEIEKPTMCKECKCVIYW